MGENSAIVLILLLAVILANLPWLNERVFLVAPEPPRGKREWIRFVEWGAFYGVMTGAGFGLEYAATGEVYPQGWEFYVTTLCLFAVAALPGFIWRHDLSKHLRRQKKRGDRLRTAEHQS